MSSPDGFGAEEQRLLLDVARRSIAHGLRTGEPLPVACEDFPPALQVPRACFVTLHLQIQTRIVDEYDVASIAVKVTTLD